MTSRPLSTAPRRAWPLRWLVAAILQSAVGLTSAAQLTLTIEGLSAELRDPVRSALTLQNYTTRDVTAAQVRRLFANAEQEIKTALEPYGYYNANVVSNLETTDKGLNAVFRITPGGQVKVTARKVQVEGDGANADSVRKAVKRFKPEEGEPFDHGTYEKSKEAVESALLGLGFLQMKATRRSVEVSRQSNTAAIDVNWQSGPRMKFGPVRFSGDTPFSEQFLQRFIPWKPDQYYSADQVSRFQQRLVDADYFATVVVQPNLKEAEDIHVPVDVQLSPAKRNVYTASAYVSTDTGPGVRLGAQRRWVNTKGHKAEADVDYAQRLQAGSLSYQIPLLGPYERSLNFGLTHRDEDTDTSKSRTDRLAANETRQWRGFTRTLGLQYLAGDFEIAEEQRFTRLLYAEGTLMKKKADDFLFTRRGYSAALGVRLAPEGLLSDTSFTQVTLDGKMIRSLGRRQRLIVRTSLGAMAVDDFDQLPPELRFFAGGDRSVRGFDYQQLGTTNAAGKVIGGEYLAVASAELEHYFLPKWGAALFVDGGDAFRAGEFELNIGAGIGVRWRSPVGVVRVDVAKPISSQLGDSIRFHISIGPDL